MRDRGSDWRRMVMSEDVQLVVVGSVALDAIETPFDKREIRARK